jgi:hypothetical protein
LQCGPPVSGAEADTGTTCRRRPPTWLPLIAVSFFTRAIKWLADAGLSRSRLASVHAGESPSVSSCAPIATAHSFLARRLQHRQTSHRALSGSAAASAPPCRWPPCVPVLCRLPIHELHRDAPVLSSLTIGSNRRSYGLTPMSLSIEPPPPLRALLR